MADIPNHGMLIMPINFTEKETKDQSYHTDILKSMTLSLCDVQFTEIGFKPTVPSNTSNFFFFFFFLQKKKKEPSTVAPEFTKHETT
jgi:hypothetical protein